jgi:hypothetical protein
VPALPDWLHSDSPQSIAPAPTPPKVPNKVQGCVGASPSGDATEKKEVDMRRRLTWFVLFSAAIVVTALYHAKKVQATPADGFTGTTLAQGRFGEIDVFNHFIPPNIQQHKHEIAGAQPLGRSYCGTEAVGRRSAPLSSRTTLSCASSFIGHS